MWTSDLLNNTKIDWLSHSSFLLAHRLSQWLLANIKKKTKWRCKCVSSQFIPRFMSNNWKGAIFHAQKVKARRKNQRKKCALAEKCNRMEYVKRWLLCRITFGRFESIRRRETAVFFAFSQVNGAEESESETSNDFASWLLIFLDSVGSLTPIGQNLEV